MMAAALALLVLAAAAPSTQPPASTDLDLNGKLYRAVFYSGPGTLTSADLAALPEPVRERLERFLARRAAFTSRYEHEANSFEQARADAKMRDIERAIVSLIEAPGIERRAVEFVNAARVAVDWKGSAQGPLEEAATAEEFLKKNPTSPAAPYVYLYIAHRQRAAFEVHERAQNIEGMKAASRKYRTFLQRARSVEEPIFALVADDLDRQPHVYLKSEHHPSKFDPDT